MTLEELRKDERSLIEQINFVTGALQYVQAKIKQAEVCNGRSEADEKRGEDSGSAELPGTGGKAGKSSD